MLDELSQQLLSVLDRLDHVDDYRLRLRIIDALFRISVQRCRLLGLFTHPHRYDQWWRRDVPSERWLWLQLEARRLEAAVQIPAPRPRPQPARLADVAVLRPPVMADGPPSSAEVRELLRRCAAA
jgi:hypothetical protein